MPHKLNDSHWSKLFQWKDYEAIKPGPGYYVIPERSIYCRPGCTIGSRCEQTSSTFTSLVGQYHPRDRFVSSAQMPLISITPRRAACLRPANHTGKFILLSHPNEHGSAPVLRPLIGPTISRKLSKQHQPGPADYPVDKSNEETHRRTPRGFTQKHRISMTRSTILPPFYHPKDVDLHSSPAFSIGQKFRHHMEKTLSNAPFYPAVDHRSYCGQSLKPGITLKGRWSPLVGQRQ